MAANKYARGGLAHAYQAGGKVKPFFSKLAGLLGEHADQRAEEIANRTLRTRNEHWSLGTDFRPMSEADFEPYILEGTKNRVSGIPYWRLDDLLQTSAPHERLWELHTHPQNFLAPSPEDILFWQKFPGFSHGLVGPGMNIGVPARQALADGFETPGFAFWQAPQTFYSPQAFSRAENQAKFAMNRYEQELLPIYRKQGAFDNNPEDMVDYLGAYLGQEMRAKEAGPQVRFTRQYPTDPYFNPNEAVDELVDFFSKNNRFAEGGQVQMPEDEGLTLLPPPPFLKDPFSEARRPQKASATTPPSSLSALTQTGMTRGGSEELDALLAKLMAQSRTRTEAPAQASPAMVDLTSAYDDYLKKIRVPDPAAVNADTGATSAYDFIPSTFRGVAREHFPEFKTMSDADLDALMKDEAVAKQVAVAYTRGSERALARAGVPASDYTRFLAHWFGPQGAVDLLTGDESRKMEDWFEGYYPKRGRYWAKANGLEGRTAADALKMARDRMNPRGGSRG